ncbi:MAG: hypothetical protein HY834_08995 [Devosia nanyangense]|uniref:Uncharacterized protein n=1 Tax=Devosia nanyangense TaxID=1228055 RepID=A0A933L308_9HYPH|nr:hypothetical protein [Devosia nanyangense]
MSWDELTEEQKVAAVLRRKLCGHTSVVEHQRVQKLQARADALGEACDWLAAHGFAEASAALEAVAFERVTG